MGNLHGINDAIKVTLFDVINEPLKLMRNQAANLKHTIEEGEVDDEPMDDIDKARCIDEIIGGLDEYPSFCDLDRKIHIDPIEDMDNYRDDGMGDVIVGKPSCRDVCVKPKQFKGMITTFNGNSSVTYQMVRSHPRFKHLTNEK
nr:hypothetical protein [Tanacetum cinerariifolium]